MSKAHHDDSTTLAQAEGAKTLTGSLPVLCVDLDGSLLATDVLWESLLLLVKHQPWTLFLIPFWLVGGKAHFKRQIAQRVILDPALLPYREEVRAFLQDQHRLGRTLVLATAADFQPAQAIATHLGIFSEVVASDGTTNVSGRQKSAILQSKYGQQGFDYLGDSQADLSVWSAARTALLVAPSTYVLNRARSCAAIDRIFPLERSRFRAFWQAIRPHQWVKNLLIFLPVVAAHQVRNEDLMFHASLAFVAFNLCASSLYLLNDLLDLQADRRHPKKRFRPLASGDLSIFQGVGAVPILLIGAFILAYTTLPGSFLGLLGVYTLTTIGYSCFLKQVPILDVLTLAGLYTIRIFAGGIAVSIPLSSWLFAFSTFFFLSLAFGKRHSELQFRKIGTHQGLERRGYLGVDKDVLSTMGIVSGYSSVLVLALYINSQDVLVRYHHPELLWFACPLILYWISRTWLMAHRGCLEDDPLLLALKDSQSYMVAAAMALLVLAAV